MSSSALYRLYGEHFVREFSSDRNNYLPDSLKLARLNSGLTGWFDQKQADHAHDLFVSKSGKTRQQDYKATIEILEKYFKREVILLELSFGSVAIAGKEKTEIRVLKPEKILNRKGWKQLSLKYKLTKERYLDSMYVFPVVNNDSQTIKINTQIFLELFPKIKTGKKLVVFTGELLWSNWLTVEAANRYLQKNRIKQRDAWFDPIGLLQQTEHLTAEKLTGLLPETIMQIEQLKNWREKFPRTNFTIRQPLAMLSKTDLIYTVPADAILQVSANDAIDIGQDIGRYPLYKKQFTKLKFPSQLQFSFEQNQLVNKNEKIATRKVVKGLLTENIYSPVKGRIDGSYKDIGFVIHDLYVTDKIFASPWRARVNSLTKSKYNYRLDLKTYNLAFNPAYKIGEDFQAYLTTVQDLHDIEEEKLLLVKPEELDLLTLDFVIKNNIRGICLSRASYSELEKLNKTLPEYDKYLTVIILNGLDIEYQPEIAELLFFLKSSLVLVNNKSCFISVSSDKLKMIYLRLKSLDKNSGKGNLQKSSRVCFSNYFVFDPCARIERFGEDSMVLATTEGVVNASLSDISLFQTVQLNVQIQ